MICTSLNLLAGFGVIVLEFMMAVFPNRTEEWAARIRTNRVIAYVKRKLGAEETHDRKKRFSRKTQWGSSRHSNSVQPLPDTDVRNDGREGSAHQSESRPAISAQSAETKEDEDRSVPRNSEGVAVVEL